MPEIVLVHGFWYRSWSLVLLKRRLENEGLRVRCFNYPTWRRNPFESTVDLAEFCRRSGLSELHLVGHSLGGLVILRMLQQQRESRQAFPAGRVVLLGSPLSGSEVARRLARSVVGRMLMRHSESSLLNGASIIAPDHECGMIAGNVPRGLGRLTGGLEGPNDGTVAVAETLSDELCDRFELAVSHTGLLFSAEVARQVAFFMHEGRFNHIGRP